MFKLLILSVVFGAAVTEPGVFYSNTLAPATYAATIAAAATTSTYLHRSSSYIAPTVYSDIALPHFIKKRSPQFLTNYVAPYVAGAPLITPYTSTLVAPAPITYSSSVLPAIAAPAHFIKKRSPQVPIEYSALEYNAEKRVVPLIPSTSSFIYPRYYPDYFPSNTAPNVPTTLCESYCSSKHPAYPTKFPSIKK